MICKKVNCSIHFDYEAYIKEYADVKEWFKDYTSQKIVAFEPMTRNWVAIRRGGEMMKILGKRES